MQSGASLKTTLQEDAKYLYGIRITLTDHVIHPLRIYFPETTESFFRDFIKRPCEISLVTRYIATIQSKLKQMRLLVDERSNLLKERQSLVTHQKVIIALAKLGYTSEKICHRKN